MSPGGPLLFWGGDEERLSWSFAVCEFLLFQVEKGKETRMGDVKDLWGRDESKVRRSLGHGKGQRPALSVLIHKGLFLLPSSPPHPCSGVCTESIFKDTDFYILGLYEPIPN